MTATGGSSRRLAVGLGAVVVAAAVVVGGIYAATGRSEEEPVNTFQGVTEQVVRGDLAENTTASGTLRFADSRTIQSARAGIMTGLPAPGTVVALGDRLYAIDNVPVFLLRGSMPAWRDFGSGMSDGPDVKQLEKSLRDLGHFTGEPDERFTWATAQAIMDWQQAGGLERTGELPLGSVVFASGDLRIGTVTAGIGDQVSPGGELFHTTGTKQIVNVELKLADQQLAVIGTPVVVRLPGGTETTGTITSVGTPTETDGSEGQKQTVIPIVIALDDPAAAAAFQEASVTVDVPSDRREDVLSVPVGALIAITPQRFGIEIVDADGTTRQVPVQTGLFAGGRVEISGEGVKAGQRVVVPQR